MIVEKVACAKCGVMILPATALRNSGRCEPCKKGTRVYITKARQEAIEAKIEAGTARVDYWTPLLEQEARNGYGALSTPQRLCFAVGQLEAEVFNGGFPRFFINTTGEQSRDAGKGLEQLGAVDCAALLEAAKAIIFGRNPIPSDAETRKRAVNDRASILAGPLEELRQRFIAASEQCDLLGQIEKHATAHRLHRVIR